MAGGVGTGFLVIAACTCCNFDTFKEVENTPEEIQLAKDSLREEHEVIGCKANIVFGKNQDTPYRFGEL